MRNLKKTLCLVLALVFVLGLCTVGVGAANGTEFSDQEAIQYDTAVKAMSGLGILIGNDDNGDGVAEYRPADNVTRAEAAKMIAYMVLGADADSYPALPVFDDVPTTHWAAGYIAYCQHNGIIAGYGNGKFGPSDPVTQAQLCRMLLSACGYGVKDEFIGDSWDQNTAKIAMQTKILKNLKNVVWDGKANREECALLTYNTLMTARQVVLDKDTNDYAWKVVGGGTFAEAAWDLLTDTGYVVYNKTNDKNARGTRMAGRTIDPLAPQVANFYVAEGDDENPDLLGHFVKITYRFETIKGEEIAVAYFVDDECSEVSGGKTLGSTKIASTYTFDYGTPYTLAFPYAAGSTTAIDTTKLGTFVLNGAGEIIAYKEDGYFLSLLTINSSTGVATVTEPAAATAAAYTGATATVTAPAGAKDGDVVTVYKFGDVYTVKPCTKETKVAITQRQISNAVAFYNNFSIMPSFADNMLDFTFVYAASGVTMTNFLAEQLDLNNTYTLYYDAEGGMFAFGDKKAVGEGEDSNLVLFVCKYNIADSFGNPVDYAQVIKADGTVDSKIRLTAAANTALTGAGMGIYEITANALGQYDFAKPATIVENAAWVSATADPKTDFSDATYIKWNGYTEAYCGATVGGAPAATSGDATSWVSYVYDNVTVGTVTVKKVVAVWYNKAAYTYTKNSYIYITGNDVKETKLVNDKPTKFWNAYKDGVAMSDLYFVTGSAVTDTTASKAGFYEYSDGAAGGYVLKALSTGAEAKDVYLIASDTNPVDYILDGKLYSGDTKGMDLSSVQIVNIINTKKNTEAANLNLSSVSALQSALLSGYNVKIAFVKVTPNAFTASVGGAIIYVTWASKNAPGT